MPHVKCNLCGHEKHSKYAFDVCPYCKGSMYKVGMHVHKEGSLIDTRQFARKKINAVKSHIHKEANKFYR